MVPLYVNDSLHSLIHSLLDNGQLPCAVKYTKLSLFTLLEAQRHFKVREETMLECCFLPHLKVQGGIS